MCYLLDSGPFSDDFKQLSCSVFFPNATLTFASALIHTSDWLLLLAIAAEMFCSI